MKCDAFVFQTAPQRRFQKLSPTRADLGAFLSWMVVFFLMVSASTGVYAQDTWQDLQEKRTQKIKIDRSFASNDAPYGVIATALQPDGKILMSRVYQPTADTWEDVSLVRRHSDGTPDPSFNADDYNTVVQLAVQPDGKILVARWGRHDDNVIVRLHSDGTLDRSFHAAVSGRFDHFVVQPDGKIIVSGGLMFEDPWYPRAIVRLNTDGSIDSSFFNKWSHVDQFFFFQYRLALQSDGKVLLSAPNYIVRFHADGTKDDSFHALDEHGVIVEQMITQDDDKILFSSYRVGENSLPRVRRLNADGSVDDSFQSSILANAGIFSLSVQPDGKILMGGDFTRINGINNNRLARLNADGTLDTSFKIGTGANGLIADMVLQPDGKLLVLGRFTKFQGTPTYSFTRLTAVTSTLSSPQ